MRLAIVGTGRMGQAVAACAREAGYEIACMLDGRANAGGAALTAERLRDVDVAVEFTAPGAVLANLDRLTALRVPAVVGTTGWYDDLPRVEAWVRARGAAVLYGANFAPGVHLFLRLVREAARLFAGREEFDGFIVETHHRRKRDAPSGTAGRLRHGVREADPGREYPVTSVRVGYVPGAHELVYDSAEETITLTHGVRSRRVFALGALRAAEWIRGRTGLYEFSAALGL